MITAGNVLLTSIASNTDEVEGLLTEIRDRPVTDSWFLLYDSVEPSSNTLTPLDTWSTTGGVVATGNILTVSSDGTASITVTLPKPATPKYINFISSTGFGGITFYINGEVVDLVTSGFFTDPNGEATIDIVFSGFVGAVEVLSLSNNDGSVGYCKPFIRRIVDDVVTDTEIDLTTPYTVTGEVRTSCSTGESGGGCDCSDELTQIKSVIDDINSKISTPSASQRSVVYSHKTSAYTATAGYKSLSVSFENEGTVNGQYAPAGYSFTHDYFDGGYASEVVLDGTSYMVWEGL